MVSFVRHLCPAKGEKSLCFLAVLEFLLDIEGEFMFTVRRISRNLNNDTVFPKAVRSGVTHWATVRFIGGVMLAVVGAG